METYHIGAAARATGVSTHTIRVWERRYGAVRPRRTPGGTRVYSESDVARLALLKQLTQSGRPISTIAKLPTEKLRELSGPEPATRETSAERGHELAQTAIDSFMRALEKLDMATAERVLMEAEKSLQPLDVVMLVVAPVVRDLGDRWQRGDLRIGHEHAAVAALRNLLGELMRGQSIRPDAPVATATTMSGELHEIGALMSAFVATACGWRVVYLGANLPVDEILHVLERVGASMLLLSLVNQRDEETAKALRDLMSRLPSNVRLLVGGQTASNYTDIVDKVHVVDSLDELRARLTRATVK